MNSDDEADWVVIGSAALGVFAAFDRRNWKKRTAFAPPESVREETPKEGCATTGPRRCASDTASAANENERERATHDLPAPARITIREEANRSAVTVRRERPGSE